MMNIERMRKIDLWIGAPLCFLLTCYDKIKRAFTKPPLEKTPRKILFLKPAEMGTSVILYPTIKKAVEMFHDAEIFFVAFEENAPIFQVLKIIPEDNILKIRTGSISLLIRDTLKTILALRRLSIDTVIDLEFFSRYTAIFSYLINAQRRVGFHRFNAEGLYRGELMTHKVSYNYYQHVGVSFMSLVCALKHSPGRIALQEPLPMEQLNVPRQELTEEGRRNIFGKLKSMNPNISGESRLVVISPNTGEWLPYRKWPIEYYAELSRRALEQGEDVFVIITGTRSAVEDAAFLQRAVAHPRLINLVQGTTLQEFIDLLNVSLVMISVDSGPAHFACMTSTSIICIFGPDTAAVFAPLSKKAISLESDLACHPCFSAFNARRPNCDDRDKPCLRSIAVQRVWKELHIILQANVKAVK